VELAESRSLAVAGGFPSVCVLRLWWKSCQSIFFLRKQIYNKLQNKKQKKARRKINTSLTDPHKGDKYLHEEKKFLRY